jgi:hypothetical protein
MDFMDYVDQTPTIARIFLLLRSRIEPMSHDRTNHIRNLVGIFLESRACLASAGVTATNAEVLDLVRLVALREAETRRTEFMTRERELTRERFDLCEPTLN